MGVDGGGDGGGEYGRSRNKGSEAEKDVKLEQWVEVPGCRKLAGDEGMVVG